MIKGNKKPTLQIPPPGCAKKIGLTYQMPQIIFGGWMDGCKLNLVQGAAQLSPNIRSYLTSSSANPA
jgi:hypothetical protein